MYFRLIVFCAFAVQVQSEQCVTPNKEEGKCVYLQMCPVLFDAAKSNPSTSVEEFIEKSICGGIKYAPMVCCGSSANFTLTEEVSSASLNKTSLLPSRKFCGYQHSDDYFREPNDTSVRINEFPWLAQILYKSDDSDKEVYRCTGSLINRKYVLTAAHCVKSRAGSYSYYQIAAVRLGEYHLSNQTDCIQEPPFDEECSDRQDYGIDKVIPHPDYSRQLNDIGLIRLNRSVEYSDYIRPICLPQPGTIFAEVGDLLTVAGWGATLMNRSPDSKKKVLTTLIANAECSKTYGERGPTITEIHLCATQLMNNTDFLCTYDSGAPVIFSHNLQWHQEGVLFFGSSFCEHQEYPEVATRVVNYMEWIIENLEP